MLKVSNSRINTWRRCHYSHFLKYVRKLEKKKKNPNLARGSVIHKCIEAYHSGKSWKKPFKEYEEHFYKTTFAEEILENGDIPKMVFDLLENYFFFYEDEEFTYLKNEFEFELELVPGITLVGFIDALVEDEKGGVWGKETKTYKSLPGREFLLFNNQSANYTWALAKLGYKVEGMMWDIVKAKRPTMPKLTAKTGVLSQAKLDSTPLSVRKGIIELGLDPNDYEEFINSHSFENYFIRNNIRLNQTVVNSILQDTIYTAREIQEKGEVSKDRNLGRDCSWCDFKPICQAELMGLDVDFIIQTDYEKREKDGDKEKTQNKGSKKGRRGKLKVH